MFKNYIITAWKVFLRRKFFTFINLFGIVLTLSIIMVASSMVDGFLFPDGPERNNKNFRVVDYLVLTNKDHSNTSSSSLGYRFIENNIFRLKTPEIISINAGKQKVAIYADNQKFEHQFRYTDANYWKILGFKFVEGRPYNQQELDEGQFVAVINKNTAQAHFGDQSAIGKTLTVKGNRLHIIGVVENVSEMERTATSDIWVPHTIIQNQSFKQDLLGTWEAILFHSDPEQMDAINEEYIHLLKNDPQINDSNNMVEAYSGAFSRLENFSREFFAGDLEYSYETNVGILMMIVLVLILLVMALPSINMINLNVSRILERSSEIGVRKAFGASSQQLVYQFIVESLILTFIGGIIAFFFSQFLLSAIEQSGFIPFATFEFNLRLFFWGLVMIFVFATVAGAYPAFKMSRLNPVEALKGGA